MNLSRMTLTALALGVALSGCSTTPTTAQTITQTGSAIVAANTTPRPIATVVTPTVDPTWTATYATRDGRVVHLNPEAPLPTDVIADLRARVPAGFPATRAATLPVANAIVDAIAAVEATGRHLVIVEPSGGYDQQTGALAKEAWGWGMKSMRAGEYDYSQTTYATPAEAHAAAEAVIAGRPDRNLFDVVDLTN